MKSEKRRKQVGRKQLFEDISKKYDGEEWYESKARYMREMAEKIVGRVGERYGEHCGKMTGTLCDVLLSSGEVSDGHILVVYGGMNGPGLWRNYIDMVASLVHELERVFTKVWMVELKNDVLDDVFTLVLGIEY